MQELLVYAEIAIVFRPKDEAFLSIRETINEIFDDIVVNTNNVGSRLTPLMRVVAGFAARVEFMLQTWDIPWDSKTDSALTRARKFDVMDRCFNTLSKTTVPDDAVYDQLLSEYRGVGLPVVNAAAAPSSRQILVQSLAAAVKFDWYAFFTKDLRDMCAALIGAEAEIIGTRAEMEFTVDVTTARTIYETFVRNPFTNVVASTYRDNLARAIRSACSSVPAAAARPPTVEWVTLNFGIEIAQLSPQSFSANAGVAAKMPLGSFEKVGSKGALYEKNLFERIGRQWIGYLASGN